MVELAMENVATSVRIAGDAVGIVAQLSAKLGKSKAQVIETALKELEARIFWSEVRESFAQAAADPVEAARQKVEIKLWERSSENDFRDEEW